MNTCSFNGEAKMIDYLFHSPQLAAQPADSVPIDARPVLPSAEQPSDHVPVVVRFRSAALGEKSSRQAARISS